MELLNRFAVIAAGCALVAGCSASAGSGVAASGPEPSVAPAAHDSFPDPGVEAVQALVAAEAKALGVPGLALGIVRDGELIAVSGYGVAPGAADIDASTVFRLGSVTKVVTAAAVLRLRDDDKLSLDDPVALYLPELAAALSLPGKEPVRLRHLLGHSSGVPTLGDGTLDWTAESPITEQQLVGSVARCKLAFEPGTSSAYSNVGMALAGLVVARVSGQPYREFVRSRLLEPLQMVDTRWEQTAYAAGRVFPGHKRTGAQFRRSERPWILGAVEPAGGLYSTLTDMARLLAFELEPSSWPAVLPAASVAESQRRSPGRSGSAHGLGWVVDTEPQVGSIVWHNGSTLSYGAWVGFEPVRKHGIVLLSATGDLAVVGRLGDLGKDALRLLAGREPSYTVAPKATVEPTPPKVIAAVGERLLGMLAAPNEADYGQSFSPQFLAAVPAEQLRTMLSSAQAELGSCQTYSLEQDRGAGQFTLRVVCAKATVLAAIAAQLDLPHLIEGLQVLPAPEQ